MKKITLIILYALLIIGNFTFVFAVNSGNTDAPSILSWFAFIVWIISSVLAWVIYHKIFDVYYFGTKGCLTEILICGFIGLIIASVIIKFPYISIPVIIVLGLYIKKKKN